MIIKISQLTKTRINRQTIKDINDLLRVLSREVKEKVLTIGELKKILDQDDFYVYIASNGAKIIGMATIYFRKLLHKNLGWIDDVVVKPEYRGQGIGLKLTRALLDQAKKNKIRIINLTIRHDRKEALALYRKLGFKKREGHLMRLILK